MLRGAWPGCALAAITLSLLSLAPASAAAANTSHTGLTLGKDLTTSTGAGIAGARRRLLPVHHTATQLATAARTGTATLTTSRTAVSATAPLVLPPGVGANIMVSPSTGDRFSETAVAADPANAQNLAASSNVLTSSFDPSFRSANGGGSWSFTPLQPATQLVNRVFFSDPGVAYSALNGAERVSFSMLGIDSQGNTELEVTSQDPNGNQASTVVDTPANEPDQPKLAGDLAGHLFAGYDTNSASVLGQPVVVTTSPTSGSSWGTPHQVWNSGGDIGVFPAVDGTTLYVAWDDYCGGSPVTLPTLTACPKPNGQILLSKSMDGGSSFLPTPVHVSDTTTGFGSILPNYATGCVAGCPPRPVGPSPQIAVNNTTHAIYVVYGDGSDANPGAATTVSTHRMHIFVRESTDGGANWSAAQRIDTGNANDSWQPSISIDQGNGNVAVAWYDRRDDVSDKLYRPYYTQFAGGDLTRQSGEVPLADLQSDPTVDCNGTGDYMSIAAAGGVAHPVWTDTRSGLPQVFTAAVTESLVPSTSPAPGGSAGVVESPNGNGWAQLPGGGRDIGVGASCQAWVIGTNAVPGGGGLWAWDAFAGVWFNIDGGGVRVTTHAFGLPRIVNNAGGIFRRQFDGTWQQLPGAGTDIASGADFSLWVTGTNAVPGGFGIYALSSTGGWVFQNGGAVRIAAAPDGTAWVVNSAHQIYHGSGLNGWALLPGAATDIGVGSDGTVWILGTNAVNGGFQTYRYNAAGNFWVPTDGGGVAITVDAGGLPWLVNSAGAIFERV